jgi:hypothetical protein
LDMDMVVDVVHAVAVVAVAFGAVANSMSGSRCRSVADRTLVQITFFLLGVPPGGVEVDGLPGKPASDPARKRPRYAVRSDRRRWHSSQGRPEPGAA